ncbi:MAG TPA: phospholipase D-like domain-containing protein [Vicinamibacterales bacterium]|nr:phospholipase D-like domain-containing protein [Vicinamibacterales bacterium]
MTRPFRRRRWLVAVLFGLALMGFLLLLAQDQETLTVQSPVPATDQGFAEYVASLVGAPVESGDRYEVLTNGDEVFPAMLDALRQAKRRISFESFIYEDGVVGDQFTDEFVKAAQRGVDVRIVLDGFGAALSGESEKKLTDAGVQVVWFNLPRPWSLEETNYRTHRKVLVVDGDVGFTGGIGLSDHWLGNAQSPDHWRDTQFKVVGPAVRGLEASFYENWLESGGLSAPALDPRPPAQQDGAQSVVVWSNPTGGASNVKLLYLLSIAGARQQIDIQSPYFILDESTQWSLNAAVERGVRIRVVTDGDITDAMPVKDASRDGYQALLDVGVEIYEYQPTMMHVKAMVVDGVWSVFGSANFDNRSFELNDELTVAVHDHDLARALTRDLGADIQKSIRLDAATWRQRPLWQKAREWFWSHYGELF